LLSDTEIAPVITLLDQRGSRVVFGQLQFFPVGEGLVWVRPLYVRPDDPGSKQVFVRRVLAWYDGRSVIGDTLSDAINRLFPQADVDLGEVFDDGSTPTDDGTDTGTDTSGSTSGSTSGGTSGGSTTPTTPGSTSDDPVVLLEEAESLFDEADEALRDGDLGLYQEKVGEAQKRISRALTLLGA
jgi:uncharacterized membrane protein (UPF0182 family)